MIRLCDRRDVASHTHLAISVANWVWNFVFWKEIRTLYDFRFSCCNPLWVFLGYVFVVCASREIGGKLDPFRDVAKIVSSWGKRKKGDGCDDDDDDDEIRVWSTILFCL